MKEMIAMTTNDVSILDTVREAVDHAAVGRVFGSPIHHEDMVVLPVAKVGGGGGGGGGTGPAPDGQENGGAGGGFGVSAKPLGVFVLKHGTVTWRPAVDVNRVVLGGQIIVVTGLLVLRALIKAGVIRPSRKNLIGQLARQADSTKQSAATALHRLGRLTRHSTQ